MPSAPQILSSRESTDGYIEITWAAPSETGYGDNGTDVLSMYQVHVSLCEAGSCKSVSKTILRADADFSWRGTRITSNLLPTTSVTYQFTVQARNSLGWSPMSAPVLQDYK
jgi:hypothetical protein